MRQNSSDDELRSYERRELTDPVASRKARELRIRLGKARPSDMILEKLPEEARLAFDNNEDWWDRKGVTFPDVSFAPGKPSELTFASDPGDADFPNDSYRSYCAESYEIEDRHILGQLHVYSESNGIWDTVGSLDDRRDVDLESAEDHYATGSFRNWDPLDRRRWMHSWEPYDHYVAETGEDPIEAYGLPDLPNDPRGGPEFRRADRRRLAECRLRALLYLSTTPGEYFALVGEAGLKWCEERPGQWHTFNPGDEDLRRRGREGSPDLRLQVERSRRGLCGLCGATIQGDDYWLGIEGVEVRRCLVCHAVDELERLDSETKHFGWLDYGLKELPESFSHPEWGGPRSWKTITSEFPIRDGLPLVLLYDYNEVPHVLHGRRQQTRITWKGIDRNGNPWYGSATQYGAQTRMRRRKPPRPRRLLDPHGDWFGRTHSAILRSLQEDWVRRGGKSRRDE